MKGDPKPLNRWPATSVYVIVVAIALLADVLGRTAAQVTCAVIALVLAVWGLLR